MIRSNKVVSRDSYLFLNQEIAMLNLKLFETNNSKIRIVIVPFICIWALGMTMDFCTLYAEKQRKKKRGLVSYKRLLGNGKGLPVHECCFVKPKIMSYRKVRWLNYSSLEAGSPRKLNCEGLEFPVPLTGTEKNTHINKPNGS